MSRKATLIMAITLLISATLSAQDRVDNQAQEAKRPVATSENKEPRANRLGSIEEVRSMSERVLRFQDSELKIRTIILLADLLWSKGQDEQGSRPLFLKADELIRSVRISKTDGPASSEKNRDVAAVRPNVVRNLKRLLIQKVSARDAAWGQRLGREYDLDITSPLDIDYQDNNEVSALIRRGQLAGATKSLQRRIDDNLSGMMPLLSFLTMLKAVRTQDAQAADRLFLEATLRMSGQPNATADDILIMGNYLFASRMWEARSIEASPIVGTSAIQLGEVEVRADLAKVRPGNSPSVMRAYIGAAILVLERASYDAEEMKRRAAGAYLLLPHAQTFAPEFASQLSGILSRSGADYSPRTNPLPLTENGKVDLSALLESADAIASSNLRDQYVLKIFRLLYSKNDFDNSLAVAEKMSDLTSRNELVSLITFARGEKSLKAGEIEMAQKNLKSVTSNLQRALLRLGLAQLYLKEHDETAAQSQLNEAVADIQRHGDQLQKPYTLLSAVELLASLDLRAATKRLRDAVKAFNALESPGQARMGPMFWETVRVGDSSATFPLRVSGVKYVTLSTALKSLSADPQGVKAVLFELKDERLLGEGILALANSLLLGSKN